MARVWPLGEIFLGGRGLLFARVCREGGASFLVVGTCLVARVR
ncbi:hypothetical protein [Actinoplanes philippinensis]|nr:hypothetical protein [Actinoplanes philippinensis]